MTALISPTNTMHGPVGTFDFLVDDGRGGNVMGSLPSLSPVFQHPPVVEADRVAQIFAALSASSRRPTRTMIRSR